MTRSHFFCCIQYIFQCGIFISISWNYSEIQHKKMKMLIQNVKHQITLPKNIFVTSLFDCWDDGKCCLKHSFIGDKCFFFIFLYTQLSHQKAGLALSPSFWLLQVRRWLISPIGLVSSANGMTLTDCWLEVQLLAFKRGKSRGEERSLEATRRWWLRRTRCVCQTCAFLLSHRKPVIDDRVERLHIFISFCPRSMQGSLYMTPACFNF